MEMKDLDEEIDKIKGEDETDGEDENQETKVKLIERLIKIISDHPFSSVILFLMAFSYYLLEMQGEDRLFLVPFGTIFIVLAIWVYIKGVKKE